MPDFVFLGIPTYAGQLHAHTAQAAYQAASRKFNVMTMSQGRGLTSPNCNSLWVSALNARLENPAVKWFAMLHADVAPEAWWLDTLIGEAEKHNADLVSAVVPVKDNRGITSTIIANPDWDESILQGTRPARYFGRLTLRQVRHSRFPVTFGINEACDALAQLPDDLRVTDAPRHVLLCNTGCMVIRLTANIDWLKVFFSVVDGIVIEGGRYRYYDISEDWTFSYRMTLAGGRCMATKAVRVTHFGVGRFGNESAWGTVGREVDGLEGV